MIWTTSRINEIIAMLAKEIAMTKAVYSKKLERGEITQDVLDNRVNMLQMLIEEKNKQLMELDENPLGLAKVASELVEFRVTYKPNIAAAAIKLNAKNIANLRFGYVAGTLSYITGLDSVCQHSTKQEVQLVFYPHLDKINFENAVFQYERLNSAEAMHKIANWKATFKRILNIDYGKPTPAELKLMNDTYSNVTFEIEHIEYYLQCQTYPFKAGEAKTIKTYLTQNHILMQMYKQKDVQVEPVKMILLNVWDGYWYNKQDEDTRRRYIAHLKGLGFEKKISSGGVTYYEKPK